MSTPSRSACPAALRHTAENRRHPQAVGGCEGFERRGDLGGEFPRAGASTSPAGREGGVLWSASRVTSGIEKASRPCRCRSCRGGPDVASGQGVGQRRRPDREG